MKTEFDYIIAGSGCAGLSLLYRILQDPVLRTKNILVVDKSEKIENDRTWCYWEKENGLFEPIVFHEWKTLRFLTTEFEKEVHLGTYSYKIIKGIDFYNHVLTFAKQFSNVVFKYENITKIETEGDLANLETENGSYTSQYLFNSTSLFNPKITTENSLLQHFEGWVIKTEKPTFNSKIGTLMDFTLSQKNGATFMYVLPTSTTEALVEYTLFSGKLLKKEEYKVALRNYIKDVLKIENYKISHTEFGVIPMSLANFSRKAEIGKRIINIGTAGGFTKASSGYTFQFIQKNTSLIVDNLKENKFPNPEMTLRDKMFQWYDRTLLEVLISEKMQGKEIFSKMFKKIPAETILAFLGNESSFLEEIKIMRSLPIKPFLTSGIKQLK
jgi:lycopene beta-cyclase